MSSGGSTNKSRSSSGLSDGNADRIFRRSLWTSEGDKVFEYLREFSKVPVAFVSGFLTPTKEKKVMSMGAVKCLRKPLELGEVKSLIHSIA